MKKCIMIIIALIYTFLGVQMLFATDTTPNQFKFTAKTKADLNTVYTSNTITVSGIDTAAPISIVGGTYSIKGGPYTSAPGTVMNGNTVNVRQTSAGSCSTKTDATLTIGGVSATFSVTTAPPDTEPKKFALTGQKNVELSTLLTSNTITVLGINIASPISIVGGEYSINGGSYTGAYGTVMNNDTVTVQQTSSASFSTITTATLTIGGVSGTFSVKTLAADPKPDKFVFSPQTDVELNTVITSNTITVSGINTVTNISIAGGTYSINGGPYTSTPGIGTVNDGDNVTVQVLSAGSYNKKTTATLTIGGVKGAFSVTTLTFTQADLTGIWRLNLLKTGSGWWRGIATVDSSGNATLSSCLRSDSDNTCGGTVHLSINASGVVTVTGNGDTKNHFTMASNKKLIVGTSTSDSNYNIMIMQKDTGASYSAGDVEGQSFVTHELGVGSENEWRYGSGTIDGSGQIITISDIGPSDSGTPGPTGQIASVDANGVVTVSGTNMATYQGFLSDDKKTIVGTWTYAGGKYILMIIQITGQTYTSDALAETWFAHMLDTMPSWIHFTAAVASDGVISFSQWVSSYSGSSGPKTTTTFKINSSGTITLAEDASLHGQMSDDGKFMVITQTLNGPSEYGLTVYTR